MNDNIKALIAACEETQIQYQFFHPSKNLVLVKVNHKNFAFSNWSTPINNQSVSAICRDKSYFYSLFHDCIRMPRTLSFLDPYCKEKYSKYLECKTIYEIIDKIEENFQYPFILKKNQGTWGRNVFQVGHQKQLEQGILTIFNRHLPDSDYICIAQELVSIKNEFRVIFLDGKHQFSYQKKIENAEYSGNLSPLHWEGSKAELVTNSNLIQKISKFCQPMFDRFMISWCGLDIAEDYDGQLWLIEANSAPGFDRFIADEGNGEVVALYKRLLRILGEENIQSQNISQQI